MRQLRNDCARGRPLLRRGAHRTTAQTVRTRRAFMLDARWRRASQKFRHAVSTSAGAQPASARLRRGLLGCLYGLGSRDGDKTEQAEDLSITRRSGPIWATVGIYRG